MIRRRILLGTLLAVLFGIGWSVGRGSSASDLYANLDTFVDVLHAVRTGYVDAVESHPLIVGALRGMLRELDPWSEYLTPKEYAARRAGLDERIDGVGLVLDLHEGYPVVVAPIEGSPAWEAGLRAGDLLVEVDGHPMGGHSLSDVGGRLSGVPGTTVRLKIARAGVDGDQDVTLTRRSIEQRSVTAAFVAAPGIGYVRLASFGARAGDEVAAALDTLRAAGAKSLVLDLRGNPGGYVEQAVAVAQAFVPEGALVVTTRGRIAPAEKRWVAGKARTRVGWPLALLVDRGSASAAEIVAGALQDADRALVVGQSTYGKGSAQETYVLRNNEGALVLTTAWFHTPTGRSLQRVARAAASDDDEEDAPADSSADSARVAPRPEFRTPLGRIVRGGGGVEPDVAVAPDTLAAPTARVAPTAAALRATIGADPAFRRAAERLARAKVARDVFALAPAASPAREPGGSLAPPKAR